jgi:hypothetical protein
MIGQKLGGLTVVGKGQSTKNGMSLVPCRCDCGKVGFFWSARIVKGQTCRICADIKHRTHGRTPFYLYLIWDGMKKRCLCKTYFSWEAYGGRGITICDRWMKFENFRSDVGERPSKMHSLDRIDNNKGYSPENCRWATPKEQSRNRRSSKIISAFGESKTLVEWSEQYNINRSTITRRLKCGWSPEKAVSYPVPISSSTSQPTTHQAPCSSSGPSGHAP